MLSIGRFFNAAAVLLYWSCATALPTDLETRQYLDLPGIDFSVAQSECDASQMADLRQAFLEVKGLAFATNPTSPAEGNDPAFLQFFGEGYNGANGGKYFFRIFDNLARAGSWPSQGNGGNGDRANKVQVRCRDVSNKCSGNLLAYAGYSWAGGGEVMVFCPFYWQKKFPHTSARRDGPKTSELPGLITQEHIILHELMHLDNLIFSSSNPRIIDRKFTDIICPPSDTRCYAVKRQAYGAYYCSRLALGSEPPTFPPTTNADSYAWFATRKYFEQAWGIKVDQVGSEGIPYTDEDGIS